MKYILLFTIIFLSSCKPDNNYSKAQKFGLNSLDIRTFHMEYNNTKAVELTFIHKGGSKIMTTFPTDSNHVIIIQITDKEIITAISDGSKSMNRSYNIEKYNFDVGNRASLDGVRKTEIGKTIPLTGNPLYFSHDIPHEYTDKQWTIFAKYN